MANGPTLHPLQSAFMEHFAAQCGFCTPGMLTAAKALLAKNASPTREEVIDAIAGNICRCTGYEPIIEAILAASRSARASGPEGGARCSNSARISSAPSAMTACRSSARARNGRTCRAMSPAARPSSMTMPSRGFCISRLVRSPHHHARIRRIDTAEAERAPGVKRILKGADVPVNKNTLLSLINFGKDDEPTLAVDKVRYLGEPIVAIIAETEAQALAARKLVRVEYETLPAVFDVEEALKPGAPVINDTYPGNYFEYHDRYDHQKLRFGDVEKGFASADLIVEDRYQMSPIEHAPTETNGSIAAPEQNDRYVVHSCAQGLFFSLGTAAKILNLDSNKLHFIGGTVGGGFGGKVDSLTEPLSILGAMMTGRPVRYVLDREEEMLYGSPRGASASISRTG